MAERKPIKLNHRWKPWEKDAAGNKIRYCYDCGACQYYVFVKGAPRLVTVEAGDG